MKKSVIKIGSLSIPQITLGGGRPRILITAGIHGDEFSQQIVLQRLLADPPQLQRGSIVILPRVNPLGLAENTEVNPTDGLNINRVFPGKKNSPNISRRIANMVFEQALQSDTVVDLHNFTDPALPQIIYVDAGKRQIRQQSLQFCRIYGFPLVWRIRANDPGMDGSRKTLIFNAVRAGIPAIGVELPPLDGLTEKEIKTGVTGLRRVLQVMSDSGKNFQQRPITIIDRKNVRAQQSGIFVPLLPIGVSVKPSSIIGKILTSDLQEMPVRAEFSGLLTRLRRAGPINKKQLIGNIGMKK
ncbi:MAG: succinylglutamate desuccinylase/aspartoacylase family protein [Patescibacteria group bacterium]